MDILREAFSINQETTIGCGDGCGSGCGRGCGGGCTGAATSETRETEA